jgi:hypothetical protein
MLDVDASHTEASVESSARHAPLINFSKIKIRRDEKNPGELVLGYF